MKKKILISLVACFIAAGSIIHFNLAQNTTMVDVSLADISVMAQAVGETPPECTQSCFEDRCNPTWKDEQCKVKCSGIDCNFGYSFRKIIV